MKCYKPLSAGLGALALAAALSSAQAQPVSVEFVGVNPFPGFPSTGGTGQIVSQTPNGTVITKDFTTLGDVPIIIHTQPVPGTVDSSVVFLHIDERVSNHTGVPWTDFHLGFGPIDNGPVVLVFQNVANPTGEFGTISPSPNNLDLFGSVPDGGTFSLSFDLLIGHNPQSFDLFGIHEHPTVAPDGGATFLLLGIGSGALFLGSRRFRKN